PVGYPPAPKSNALLKERPRRRVVILIVRQGAGGGERPRAKRAGSQLKIARGRAFERLGEVPPSFGQVATDGPEVPESIAEPERRLGRLGRAGGLGGALATGSHGLAK